MSRMRLALVLAIALTAPMFAGCLEVVTDPDDRQDAVRRTATPKTVAPRAQGTMSGDESATGPSAVACGGVSIPPQNLYCATKTITLEGTMEGMDELPVTLDTFVGDINVAGVDGSKWSVTVTLEANGESEQEAIANLDNIQFSWSHEAKDGHHLKAFADKKDQNIQNNEAAHYDAKLPNSVTYFLTCDNAVGTMLVTAIKGSQVYLDSASGDLSASDVESKWFFADTASGSIDLTMITSEELHADTASGDVHVTGKIGQTTVDSASGNTRVDIEGADLSVDAASGFIEAKFTPTASGSVYLESTSAGVEVILPEGPGYGYSVDASTTSGSVEISLKDGQTSGEEEEKHFVSSNYSKREKRTEVEATTTSGSVFVEPS